MVKDETLSCNQLIPNKLAQHKQKTLQGSATALKFKFSASNNFTHIRPRFRKMAKP